MCEYKKLIDEYNIKGELVGMDLRLALAQAKDYVKMEQRMNGLENQMSKTNSRLDVIESTQKQGFDMIMARLNSNAVADQDTGRFINSVIKSKHFRWIVIGGVALFVCVGITLVYILEKSGAVVAITGAIL